MANPHDIFLTALHRHDLFAGGIFIAFAVFFLGQTFGMSGLVSLLNNGPGEAFLDAEMPIGTARRMGPGYFPLLLSGLLFVLGAILMVRGLAKGPDTGIHPMPWRGLLMILGATIFFGATVRGLGLVPTTAISVLLSAYASQRMTLRLAAILSVVLTIFVLAAFHYGLGLPLRLYGPWLDPVLGADR